MNSEKLLPPNFLRLQVLDKEGLRLIDFLVDQEVAVLPGEEKRKRSASWWRQQIDKALIWIEAKPAQTASHRLKKGSLIIYAPEVKENWKLLDKLPGLAVFYKPAGALFDAIIPLASDFGFEQLFPVHRLDKMTSGLILFATDREAAREVEEAFYSRKVNKSYLAFCWNEPSENSGIIKKRLLKRESKNRSFLMKAASRWDRLENSVEATTMWRVIMKKQGISLIECRPISGRMHQIRAHLHDLNVPILGDSIYQHEKIPKNWWGNIHVSQHMLEAYRLEMVWQGEKRSWWAPLSYEFNRLVTWLDPSEALRDTLCQGTICR